MKGLQSCYDLFMAVTQLHITVAMTIILHSNDKCRIGCQSLMNMQAHVLQINNNVHTCDVFDPGEAHMSKTR